MSDAVTATVGRLIGFEPAALANPYPLYAELREAGACHRVADEWGLGSWHVTRYADIGPALRDPRLSNRGVIRPPELAQEQEDDLARIFWKTVEGSLLTADPPDHTRLRKLVAPAFTPKRVQALRPRLEAIVDDLLTVAEAKSEFDFIADFANPLPLMAIAVLMGVPREDWPLFRRLADGLFDFQPSPQTMLNVEELVAYLRRLAAQRHAEPQDDLISALVHAREDADALTDDELMSQLFVLLTGGIDTTSAGLGNSLMTLLRHPGMWGTFGVQAHTVDPATEELLRFESPFQYSIRRALSNIELGGQTIAAGDFVWLWLGSANRDSEVFAKPDELNLARADNKHLSHLAFGMGIHYCLGAPLARLEMQVALRTLRQRYPKLHLTQDEVVWRSGSFVRSLEALPVAFR